MVTLVAVTLVAISSMRVFKLERSAEFLRTSRNTTLKKSFTVAFLVRSTLDPLNRLLASSSDTNSEVLRYLKSSFAAASLAAASLAARAAVASMAAAAAPGDSPPLMTDAPAIAANAEKPRVTTPFGRPRKSLRSEISLQPRSTMAEGMSAGDVKRGAPRPSTRAVSSAIRAKLNGDKETGDASRFVPGRGTMPGKLRLSAQKEKGLATRESIGVAQKRLASPVSPFSFVRAETCLQFRYFPPSFREIDKRQTESVCLSVISG